MQLNTDLDHRTLVHGALLPWVPSPSSGVERRMLYRVGGEKARATSLVKYAAGSVFPVHSHPGGEEFFVLEGTLQDERGDYPAGTYVRNPPGSRHAPRSDQGCVIFLRLQQFDPQDTQECVVQSEREDDTSSAQLLFCSTSEQVKLERLEAGALLSLANPYGMEVLALAGSIVEGKDLLERMTWLRLPRGMPLQAQAGQAGTRLWIKRCTAP
ncbi:cupin [Pseudomonas sp. DTU12.3]|uniref:cupin domain-containing protein n=1 Tax=Pseudomonas sp. DTU12.3 TaxID=2073078 RepID=UPI0010133AA6|nr:cupin domain-containing protein [Pseudomonas sp. DTU12.3]QAX84655.1 cupin [Pseudomonas sp. DTU12.3]